MSVIVYKREEESRSDLCLSLKMCPSSLLHITKFRVQGAFALNKLQHEVNCLLSVWVLNSLFLNSQLFLVGCRWSMMSQNAMKKLLTAQNSLKHSVCNAFSVLKISSVMLQSCRLAVQKFIHSLCLNFKNSLEYEDQYEELNSILLVCSLVLGHSFRPLARREGTDWLPLCKVEMNYIRLRKVMREMKPQRFFFVASTPNRLKHAGIS